MCLGSLILIFVPGVNRPCFNLLLSKLFKIIAKPDSPKRGYHFINANNQTFVDYWVPFEVENESWAVVDIVKAKNYLKSMND